MVHSYLRLARSAAEHAEMEARRTWHGASHAVNMRYLDTGTSGDVKTKHVR